jgi:uncharacterized tellurite resistance protein B-like protein
MFADRLTPEQRQATFDLALMLAAADHEVSEEELEYLKNFSQAFDIPFKTEPLGEKEIDDLLTVFESRLSRIVLLQELIKLSYKDGHFGKEEQDKVFMIAQKLGLNNPDLLIRIEKWVREGFDWLYEGEEMIND